MTTDQLYGLLERAWEHVVCERGFGIFCNDDYKRREEFCEPCAVRQDIEDALNVRAAQSDSPRGAQ